ncbi:MAG: RibD family protein, partial [candidate division Zixibacteria bacterium]
MAPIFKPSESFMVVHMAQSLDGMVATEQGNSQWVGNSENLAHAHRLRALVDGVMVGGTTAHLDLPGLNVRHVAGSDPARIFLSDTFVDIDKLPQVEGMRTIFLRSGAFAELAVNTDGNETIVYDEIGGQIDVHKLLAVLRKSGIQSILLEGGPKTFRTFFQAGAITCLHAHIAPTIFGSGRSLLELPKISRLEDSVKIKNPYYVEMGDAIMVIG